MALMAFQPDGAYQSVRFTTNCIEIAEARPSKTAYNSVVKPVVSPNIFSSTLSYYIKRA